MGLTVRDDTHPEGDVELVYTGLRPAEKLFEELLIGNNVTGTEHSMIMRAMEHSLPWGVVQQVLEELLIALNRFDCRGARELLMQTVAEYRPAEDIQDLVWLRKQAAIASDGKVADLAARRARQTQAGV
jgi:FlaA1/EpsC-like NDP-sugar epimerase